MSAVGRFFSKENVFWLFLISAALGVRLWVVFGLDHPAFDGDEAQALEFGRAFGTPAESDFSLRHQALSGVRIFLAKAAFFLGGGHPFAPAVLCCFLYTCAIVLFVFLLEKEIGRETARLAGTFLAFAPPYAVFYSSTLLQRHLIALFLGLVFWIGKDFWLADRFRAFLFGAGLVYGLYERWLFLFYGVPLAILWFWNGQFLKLQNVWKSFLLGIGVSSGIWWFFSPDVPAYDPENFSVRPAALKEIFWHFRIFLEAYPRLWFANLPLGNLQETLFAESLNRSGFSLPASFFRVFFGVTLGTAFWGLYQLASQKPNGKKVSVFFAIPGILFLIFFLFGSQVKDLRGCRYLIYFPFVVSLGLAVTWVKGGRMLRGAVALIWIAHFSVLFLKFFSGPTVHPARVALHRLEVLGLSKGFASGWLSEPVRYFSRGKILLTPYNLPPLYLPAVRKALTGDETYLVWIPSLDKQGLGPTVMQEIQKAGFGEPSLLARWVDFEVFVFPARPNIAKKKVRP